MIRTKLFLGLTLLVAIFGSVSAVIGVRLIRGRVVEEAQTRVELDLSSAWSIYGARLQNIETILQLVASGQLVPDVVPGPQWLEASARSRLEVIRLRFGLDFLTVVSPEGQVLARSAPPYRTGDYAVSHLAILKALEGEAVTATELMSPEELDREQEGLAETAFTVLEDTPHARRTPRTEETRGLVMLGAVPLKRGSTIVGAVYGGVLLNKNHELVDNIRGTVFRGTDPGRPATGTVTIFLHDSRVATTVLLPNGNRALGTRVSKEVAESVLDNGNRWSGRAFVVNDWYLTAYDPIRDSQGRIVGMLYVGILERPFRELTRNILLRYAALSVCGVAVALLLAFFLAGRLARPIHQLAGAAQKMREGHAPEPVSAGKGSREIHSLVRAFNEMAAALTSREKSLKETNDKLEQANASLKSLNQSYMETVGFISHELKNPLATMLSYVYMLREEKLGPLEARQRRAVKVMDRNVRLLAEMVRHYLDLSRIENGNFAPQPARVAVVEEVLAPLLETIAPAVSAKGMRVENNVGQTLCVHGDRNMIWEVFDNLLSNAVKYGREGGLIRLDAEAADGTVRFRVFNEGEGISEENRSFLFRRFSRLDSPATRRQKGTGLGLYLTKYMVEAHGGSISVASEAGRWVEFRFGLPADGEQPAGAQTDRGEQPSDAQSDRGCSG